MRQSATHVLLIRVLDSITSYRRFRKEATRNSAARETKAGK